MVNGSIQKGETAFQAAVREVKEETGIIAEKLFVVPQVNSIFLPDKDEIIFVPIFGCLVNKNSKVVISTEHIKYRWVNLKKAKKLLAWPGQKKAVKLISEYWNKEKETIKFVSIKK
jgi:dATP pyrophosphohydrolase